MDTVYWISLIVGGFFVLLSLLGGSEADTDVDADVDADFDADFDFDADVDTDFATHADAHVGSGVGFVDLLSVRALFLFAAFFGLTGVVLDALGAGGLYTALVAVLTGLVVGLGGNYFIKRVGYAHVSSNVTEGDLQGRTAEVLVPFEGARRGKISLVVKGHRMHLLARPLDAEVLEAYERGDEVVVVRMEGGVAEVVKPD